MALGSKAGKLEIHDLKICGEIVTLLSMDRKEFFLNCKFCDHSYLQLDNFIKHVCDDHSSNLRNLNENQSSCALQLKEESEYDDINPDANNFLDANHEHIDFKGFETVEMEINPIGKKDEVDDAEETFFEERMSSQPFKKYEDAFLTNNINKNHSVSSIAECGRFNSRETSFCERKDVPLLKEAKKKFTIGLIELYRSLPALWNLNSEDYENTLLKDKQLEILLTKYRERYPSATKEDVNKKMDWLYTQFNREWKEIGSSGISSLYYFDEIKFLKDFTQTSELKAHHSDLNELDDISEIKSTKIYNTGSSLNGAQIINLANIYKRHTCLWDENEITYRFSNRRQEALDNILKEFRKTSGLTTLTKNGLEKEISLLRKLCSKEKKKKIACKRDNTDFKPTCPLYHHFAFLDVNVAPYECSICGDLISAWTLHKKHLASHDGSPPYKCHVCGHGFTLPNNLTVHLRAHAQDFTFSCEVCSKAFATTTQLKTHMRRHTGEKPFVCYVCGKEYKFKSTYLLHIQRHENKPRHKCDICSKPFYDTKRLKEHINAHLQLRDYICNVCDKGFTCAKLLRQHKQIHDKEKKYLCKICGKRFAQAAGLNSHMKSHGTKLVNINTESNDL